MEVDVKEVEIVHEDIKDLNKSISNYIRELIKVVRVYNYTFGADYAGKIKLSGFKSQIRLNMYNMATFDLKYKRELLIHLIYKPYEESGKLKIDLYTGEYMVDMENIGLIKEFAAEIKKKIEVINISMGDII